MAWVPLKERVGLDRLKLFAYPEWVEARFELGLIDLAERDLLLCEYWNEGRYVC